MVVRPSTGARGWPPLRRPLGTTARTVARAATGMKCEPAMNDVMRFTVVDPFGTVSFVAPCTALEALVAACSHAPQSLNALLSVADSFAPGLHDRVSSGLAVFDEHNSRENFQAIHGALEYYEPRDVPVFRVVDERTRD